MIQSFDLKINGKSELIENARLLQTFDTPADGFKALMSADTPELAEAFKPYHPPPCAVYLDGELMLTGAITNPNPSKTPNSAVNNIEGFSNTYNFMDSALEPPYEYNNQDLEQLVNAVAAQTNTTVIFTEESTPPRTRKQPQPPSQRGISKSIFDRATVIPGQTGYTFCLPLAKNRNMVMSSTPEENLILQQPDFAQQPVGTLSEGEDFELTNYSASYNYRDRFRTFKVILDTPTGSESTIVSDSNITQPRHKIIKTSNQIAGGLNATANYFKNLAIVEALSEPVNVIGWKIGDKLWKSGTLITIKSQTLGYPEGFTFFIRAVEYIQTATEKMATLFIIPPNVYTNEPVVEPWFL